MAKKQEKNPVGRPKLAEPELIKKAWCQIAVSLLFVFVFVISGMSTLTSKTPLRLLTFTKADKLQGNVNNIKYRRNIPANKTNVIYLDKEEKRIINTDGTITRVIPANETKTIKVSE